MIAMIENISNTDPAFFDIFGVLAFIYIVFVAHSLLQERKLARPLIVLLLLVGLAGLVVDSLIVSSNYLIR